MAESKKNLKIRFEGRLDNLVINYGGKILYSYKREKKKETGKTEKQIIAQAKTAITAELCSQMNKIPAMKYVWRWANKERTPYRNMLAANLGHALPEHLTVYNIISPKSRYYRATLFESIDSTGIDLKFGYGEHGTIETESGKTFSVIAIICLFNPFDKTKKSYSLYTLSKELMNFQIEETYDIRIPFEGEALEDISSFQNCTVHSCVLFDELKGDPHKWVSTYAVELDLDLEEREKQKN